MRRPLLLPSVLLTLSCARAPEPVPARPSILLVTLDTTRADAIGPEARDSRRRRFNALGGARTALPAGVRDGAGDAAVARVDDDRALSRRPRRPRERARWSCASTPLAAERAPARRLSHRGVRVVVRAGATLRSRARLRRLRRRAAGGPRRARGARRRRTARSPTWRDRPRPRRCSSGSTTSTRTRRTRRPSPSARASRRSRTSGEVAAMDAQLGRLVAGVRARARRDRSRSWSSPITARASATTARRSTGTCSTSRRCTCRSSLVGPGVAPGVGDGPVSTRRVFHTLLDWAGLGAARQPARRRHGEVVLGEAMKPFLSYGWQPQVMAVDGPTQGDPRRARSRSTTSSPIPARRATSGDGAGLPRPVAQGAARLPAPVARRRGREAPLERRRAPPAGEPRLRRRGRRAGRPPGRAAARRHGAPLRRARTRVGPVRARASTPARSRCSSGSCAEDPGQPRRRAAARRPRTRRSATTAAAVAAFETARALAPDSPDVAHLPGAALRARTASGRARCRCSSAVVAGVPDRLPALEALATVRERQGRTRGGARALRQRVDALRAPAAEELLRLGRAGDGRAADARPPSRRSSRRARRDRARFRHDLELGVLYLAARRLAGGARRARSRPAAASRVPAWRSSSARR